MRVKILGVELGQVWGVVGMGVGVERAGGLTG